MRRRDFISLAGGATIAWPLGTLAQQSGQMRRIGVLIANRENDPEAKRALQALLQGLQELGWKPGINLQIEIRYGEGQPERIAAAAKELVAAQPELLVIETTKSRGAPDGPRRRVRSALGLVEKMNDAGGNPFFEALFNELRRLGYVEGEIF